MTREEFDNTKWHANMKLKNKRGTFDLVAVDFEEALIALDDCNDIYNPNWYRCESVELV